MAGAKRTSPSAPYQLSVALILLCGAIVAILLYREGRRAEDQAAESEFTRRATVRHTVVREVLHRHTDSLFGVSAMFALHAGVTRRDFMEAAAQLRQRLSGIVAIEWVPAVTREDRAAVEAQMRSAYPQRGFEFVDFDADGRWHRAPDRPLHYPICFAEPVQGNAVVLGYDLAAAAIRTHLERARNTRQMIVSNQFPLAQDTSGQPGLVVIWPVYRNAEAGSATAAETGRVGDAFAGFVQCVFRAHDLLQAALSTEADSVLDSIVVDEGETDPTRRILHHSLAGGGLSDGARVSETGFKQDAPFTREFNLMMGERTWRLIFRPRAEWMTAQRTWGPVAHASAVMALSSLLAGLVRVIGRRTETIRREVDVRTVELTESRRQLANLLHALPGMAYRARYEGKLEILFASEGTLTLTGWAPEAFISGAIHVRTMIHPDDVDRVRAETRTALRARRDVEVQYRLRTRDGAEKHVLSRGHGVYDANGNLTFVDGIIIDITAAKQAEDARLALERKLLETQKLESLGLLAGGIAHDFNNLLSAILGNASLARMSLAPGNGADPQLRAIETASLRAAELCRQMLAYAGKGRLVVERVDVSAIIEDLLPLLRVSIARSASLHLELAHDLPTIKADATQLRQIVMNLVLNAVDAIAGREGRITLRTGVVEVDRALLAECVTGQSLPVGPYVFVEVTDNGCGMAADVQAKIFDPFFTTKFAGRGLGLAAVLGIVRSHNGALCVRSEVDRGSEFRLYLPAMSAEPVPDSAVAATPPAPWRRNGDVLVIDDEEPVRVVTAELLKSFGFSAQTAEDGRSGIAVFRENASRWALVVVDQLMPGMSGEETVAALRAIRSDLRALLISGYTESEPVSRMRANGGGRIGFLSKPFSREVFEEKLRELLD